MNFKCACGEIDPSKFYGHKRSVCGECHNKYTIAKGQETKLKIIAFLGGKCEACGYNKFPCSLDIHHTDPSMKDPNFRSIRYWTWKRILLELSGCKLLCRNCHAAFHSGLIQI